MHLSLSHVKRCNALAHISSLGLNLVRKIPHLQFYKNAFIFTWIIWKTGFQILKSCIFLSSMYWKLFFDLTLDYRFIFHYYSKDDALRRGSCNEMLQMQCSQSQNSHVVPLALHARHYELFQVCCRSHSQSLLYGNQIKTHINQIKIKY